MIVVTRPTESLDKLFVLDIGKEATENGLNCLHPGIRSIDRSEGGGELLLGTLGS